MKLSPSSYLCLLITALGLLRAIQLNYTSTKDLRVANEKDDWYSKQQQQTSHSELVNAGFETLNKMGDQPDNILYFVQVSDLHISKYQRKGHTLHFLHFLRSALPVMKPEFVVVTGDLTDAKDKTKTTSKQYPEEWQMYKSAVEQGANGTTWYDMRGNHDCFDLVNWKAENNYYRTFGKSAELLNDGKGVYSWEVMKPFGKYHFVAVDSCPKKGPSRPFNFFGYLTTNAMNRLVSKIIPSVHNHTFLFSHYPTTTMVPGVSSEGYHFRDLADHFSIYFCGHLHRLAAGLGEVLKSYSKNTDSLELELSDMKDHGSYRIVAIDHDLISFVDIDLPISEIPLASEDLVVPLNSKNKVIWPKKINPAPVVLITNPKDSRYTLPTKEPLQNSRHSTHIRFLVFSEHKPKSLVVKVFVDGKSHPFPVEFVGSNDMPLWTSVWEPNDFDDFGTHELLIQVTAPDGQVGTRALFFRMDNMRVKIQGGAGEWIIWSSTSSIVRCLSIFAILAMLITLVVPKIFNDYERYQADEHNNLRNKILLHIHEIDLGVNRGIYVSIQKHIYTWTHRFLQFPEEQPYVWYMCFFFLLSLFTLPWFRAEFIPSGKDQEERMGYFYLWGLLFEQQWVPMADTWLYAIFQLTFNVGLFVLFFIWKSTNIHELRCKGVTAPQDTVSSHLYNRLYFQVLILVYWLWRAKGLSELATLYGGVWHTLILNLLVWWLIAVAVVIVIGKQGVITAIQTKKRAQMEPLGGGLVICAGCRNATSESMNTDLASINAGGGEDSQILVSDPAVASLSTNIPEESRGLLFDDSEASSNDSSSAESPRKAFRRNAMKKD